MLRAPFLLFLAGCGTLAPVPEVEGPGEASPPADGSLQAYATGRLGDTEARFGRADPAWTAPVGADLSAAARAWVTEVAPRRGVEIGRAHV